jgi:hypothetical protein
MKCRNWINLLLVGLDDDNGDDDFIWVYNRLWNENLQRKPKYL